MENFCNHRHFWQVFSHLGIFDIICRQNLMEIEFLFYFSCFCLRIYIFCRVGFFDLFPHTMSIKLTTFLIAREAEWVYAESKWDYKYLNEFEHVSLGRVRVISNRVWMSFEKEYDESNEAWRIPRSAEWILAEFKWVLREARQVWSNFKGIWKGLNEPEGNLTGF